MTTLVPKPISFMLKVDDLELDDLRARLSNVRLPHRTPGDPWAFGTDVEYMRELIDYWREGFDWRAQEEALNALPQFRLNVAGTDIHYLHVVGKGPCPTPLLLLHGWPGSVFEFLDIIPRLTDPARFGGDPNLSFTVIAPSLPGFGLSFAPGQKRLGLIEAADAFAELMSAIGYDGFAVQGGDFGAGIGLRMAYAYPELVSGLHLNLLSGVGRDSASFQDPDAREQQYLTQLATWTREHVGYQWIQGTRPQTLAFGLTDSPAGLAAWIADKFVSWSSTDGAPGASIPRDRMLANISLYWLTGAISSSFWPYYANRHGPPLLPAGEKVAVPLGYAEFPDEVLRPPRSAADRVFSDIRRWTVMATGGHFAAMEQPAALASEITAFIRQVRDGVVGTA